MHGSTVILTSWHLTDWGVPFSPTNYTLPSPPNPVSLYLTVILRNSGTSCHDFMNFACHCGSVYRAQWSSPGTAYVTYYLESDAWRCLNELRGRHFEAGTTNVSDPFNRECQCLSGFRESLSCQVFLGRLAEHFAIAGKIRWCRNLVLEADLCQDPYSSLYDLCLNPSAIEAFS